jgi:hypothetical protein
MREVLNLVMREVAARLLALAREVNSPRDVERYMSILHRTIDNAGKDSEGTDYDSCAFSRRQSAHPVLNLAMLDLSYSSVGPNGLDVNSPSLLDPVMPAGSRVGQSKCRALVGIRLALTNLAEFPDDCNHLHIDVAFAGNKPLTLG